jgi:hypothetical protein
VGVADRYLTSAQVDVFLGTSVRSALVSDSGASITGAIETATGIVQGYLRNSGYETPTADGAVTFMLDELVKAATMGALWPILASRPEFGMALPDDWKNHPLWLAFAGLISGDMQPGLSRTSRDAVGGMTFTDGSSTTAGGRVPRASRTELAGY